MSSLARKHQFVTRSSMASLFVAALFSAATSGCAADDSMDPSQRNAAIIGGVETFEHPEVGQLSGAGCVNSNINASPCVLGCTATLVSSHVAITAAHCVHYESRDTPGTSYGGFTLNNGVAGANLGFYRVVGYRSFGTAGNGSVNDLALVHLEAVQAPGFAVTPAGLASVLPPNGDTIVDFGYGCTNRDTNAGAGIKRKFTYRFDSNDEPDRGCPGDSGGPHIASNGQIIRINSGYVSRAYGLVEHDEYGDPVRHHAELLAQIAAWDPAPCPSGTVACGAGCADLRTDSANCGSCGSACTEGRTCQAGSCATPAPPCGDGVCDAPHGETGASCGLDCCDAQTDCDQSRLNAGREYCRSINGGPFEWTPPAAALEACDEPSELCATTFRCAARSGICGSLPGGFRDGLCTDALFTDVPASDPNTGYIDLLYRRGITQGCGDSPRRFCPADSLTRGQMAVFVMRARFGEGFTASGSPYFTDVPPSHVFFRYVQGLRDRGITSGCTPDTFCVDGTVTRGEAAVFVVRARFGEEFNAPTTPYFTDVPPSHEFFRYIQMARALGFDAGCSGDTFCVDAPITREQMAALVARGLLGAG